MITGSCHRFNLQSNDTLGLRLLGLSFIIFLLLSLSLSLSLSAKSPFKSTPMNGKGRKNDSEEADEIEWSKKCTRMSLAIAPTKVKAKMKRNCHSFELERCSIALSSMDQLLHCLPNCGTEGRREQGKGREKSKAKTLTTQKPNTLNAMTIINILHPLVSSRERKKQLQLHFPLRNGPLFALAPTFLPIKLAHGN